jgi:hypothetical protein
MRGARNHLTGRHIFIKLDVKRRAADIEIADVTLGAWAQARTLDQHGSPAVALAARDPRCSREALLSRRIGLGRKVVGG